MSADLKLVSRRVLVLSRTLATRERFALEVDCPELDLERESQDLKAASYAFSLDAIFGVANHQSVQPTWA